MSKIGTESSLVESRKGNIAIAGACSGILTRSLCQPLDVIKIRFQLQIEPISRRHEKSKYQSFLQAVSLISKEEGFLALWRGHTAAQLLSITYGVVQFEMYEAIKLKASEYGARARGVETYSSLHFIAGTLAGGAATFLSFPFDVLRTRIIAQGNNKYYTGVVHGIYEIYSKEGVKAYWRGLTPALIVTGPAIGFQFTFFELTKYAILYLEGYGVSKDDPDMSAVGNFVAGSVAGFFSKVITYPFDLARKRLQIQDFQHARVGFGQNFFCTGLMVCFHSIRKNEGFFGLYKGLLPSVVKSAATTALHFTFYEESLKILDRNR